MEKAKNDLLPALVISKALNEVSYISKEDPPGSDNNPYGAEIDAHMDTWRWYNGRKNHFAWCTQFHDDMFIRAYGVENARKMLCRPENSMAAVVKYSYNYYKQKGRIGNHPVVGASIFFQNKDGLSHIGIVSNYDAEYVYTIEGNTWTTKDTTHHYYVFNHKYKRTDSYIYGYGYPAYDDEPVHSDYEVGKTYHVICRENLKLREYAGTSHTEYGSLKKGAPVYCEQIKKDALGNTWLRFGALWCCGIYGKEVYIK